jgi:hypothetical protein
MSELDGRNILVREDREDRDIKRPGARRPGPRQQREGESSGLQVRAPFHISRVVAFCATRRSLTAPADGMLRRSAGGVRVRSVNLETRPATVASR